MYPTLIFWIVTNPGLVVCFKCCTGKYCFICSVHLSKTLVPAYTEVYILNLHYIKAWNKLRILLHWSDRFFFSVLGLYCRAIVITSDTVLCFVYHNYKNLYSKILRHCSNKAVKLCGCWTHCVQCKTH